MVKECIVPEREPVMNLSVITMPFERIAIDVVGQLQGRTDTFKLAIMDMATRYPEAIALRRVDTEAALEVLINFFSIFGLPKEVLSDRGMNFTSTLMKETAKRLGVGYILASPYHSETNGMLDRCLKAMLRKLGSGRLEWDLLLPMLLFAYREATHEATGFSPFELLKYKVRGPLDIIREQWEEIEHLPVSVADYLSALYQKMNDMAEIAGKRDKEAK